MTNDTVVREWVLEGQIDGGDWLTVRIKPVGAPLRKLASGWLSKDGAKGKLRMFDMEEGIAAALRRRESFREERLVQRLRNIKTGEVVPIDVIAPTTRD